MAHAHSPRRNKVDEAILRSEGGASNNVIPFPVERAKANDGNRIPGMPLDQYMPLIERIRSRYQSAQQTTEAITREIVRAERQFDGLFEGQDRYREPDDDDNRVYPQKTLEHAQVIYSHLDNLTGQLRPLITMTPAVSGIMHMGQEFERAKVKELLTNYYLEKNKFKQDVLGRWRWNFLKHPSAYLRVVYETSEKDPDIRIDLVDRAALYIDPNIVTGDIKDANWVIERDFVSRGRVERLAEQGFYHLPEGTGDFNLAGNIGPRDPLVANLIGFKNLRGHAQAAKDDELIERWHYWQAEKDGNPHIYGVMLGGLGGELVLYGPNPYPYKGIPYRGKSYLRDPYKPDGISLSMQYRSIQEVYTTFLNLRISDVLENVKRRVFLVEQLFNDKTKADIDNDQQFVRLNGEFIQALMNAKIPLNHMKFDIPTGDSTQHLLSDLQFLSAEGKDSINVSDVFRGQNPQSGATLGQVQEQLYRALGVFRPIYQQEMSLVEEIAEIINVYFEDEDFFGEERLVQIMGKNRYKDVVSNFYTHAASGMAVRSVTPDEMDVDVTIDVANQADAKASRTLENGVVDALLENLRHHPKLMEAAQDEIDFTALLIRRIENTGQDIESFTFTDEQKKQNAQRKEQKQQQAMQKQIQMMQATEDAKGAPKIEMTKIKAQGDQQLAQITTQGEHAATMEEIMAKVMSEHQSKVELANQDFMHQIQLMLREAALERATPGTSVGHGNNVNQ